MSELILPSELTNINEFSKRDYISYGVCRLIMYALMSLSYGFMAASQERISLLHKMNIKIFEGFTHMIYHIILFIFQKDYFQYFWIVQFGSGIGILLNGIQFLKLFPNRVGILLGVNNALVRVLTVPIRVTYIAKSYW